MTTPAATDRTPGLTTRTDGEAHAVERLRQRARKQTTALAGTIAELERLRTEIRRHLPRQRS